MPKFIIKYLSFIATIYVLSMFVDTIQVYTIPALLIMGFVLLIVNLLLKPLLLLLTLPFNVITIGLFSFIVNAWTIMIADSFVSGVHINGFLSALLCAFIIAILNHLLYDSHKRSN